MSAHISESFKILAEPGIGGYALYTNKILGLVQARDISLLACMPRRVCPELRPLVSITSVGTQTILPALKAKVRDRSRILCLLVWSLHPVSTLNPSLAQPASQLIGAVTQLERSGIVFGNNSAVNCNSITSKAGTMAAGAVSRFQVPLTQPIVNDGSILDLAEQLRNDGKNEIPKDLTITETERSTVRHDEWKDLAEIPVIDLSLLKTDRAAVVKQIHTAVTEWGFFQILNHGLPLELLKEARAQGMKFFELPSEIKNKASVTDDGAPGPYSGNGSTQSFSSLHWAESVVIYPKILEKLFIRKVWPNGNQELCGTIAKFSSGAELIAKQLFELIAESVGLKTDFFSQHYEGTNKAQVVRWNYYPVCPRPSESIGASSHTDPNCITLLLQDSVGGLQVEKEGQWVGIRPIEGALVINIGDILHAWTNGICKSVLHRVVVNKEVPRLSIAVFVNVGPTPIYPPPKLIDESHPRLYKTVTTVGHLKELVEYKDENKGRGRDGVAFLAEKFKYEESENTESEEARKLKTNDLLEDVF